MSNSNGRSWLGIVLIILGAVFLLRNLDIVPYEIERLIFSWQAILLLIGILILSKSRDNFMGLLFVAVGGVSLGLKIFHYSYRNFFSEFWPVILIVLGLYILWRRKDFSHHSHYCSEGETGEFSESGESYIDETAVFGGIEKRIKTNQFKGGKITAIFGGVDIDLYDSQLADGEQVLDMVCIFGGFDIVVPKNWQVIVKTTAIFGGIDDQRRQDSGKVYEEGKVLVIKGLVLFGGGDIKN
ncbi:LiaI-LiaF-like domain-containing protein [Bacteroidota bacterium]